MQKSVGLLYWFGSNTRFWRSTNQVSLTIANPRINNQIAAPELRVIDERGENLGIMSREKALALAKERNIDLIEIVPQANPPVARLMSFDKYRYVKGKEEKKERLAQKSSGLKHVQISPRAAQNDLLIKARQLEEFLSEGHPVEIRVRLRGREKGNKPWAFQKLQEFLKMVSVEYKIVSEPSYGGMGIIAHIIKK